MNPAVEIQSLEIIQGPCPRAVIQKNGKSFHVNIATQNLDEINQLFNQMTDKLLSEKENPQPFSLSQDDRRFFASIILDAPLTSGVIVGVFSRIMPEEIKSSYKLIIEELLKGTFNLSSTATSEFSLEFQDDSNQCSDELLSKVDKIFERYSESILKKAEGIKGVVYSVYNNKEKLRNEISLVKWFHDRLCTVIHSKYSNYKYDIDASAKKLKETLTIATNVLLED
ncbi:MAG: hypothetical protein AAGG81_07685 [Chlamydiota bacterium]